MTGLESCINVSDIEKRTMWSALKGEDTERDPCVNQIVSMLALRARYNMQRHYEIYAVDTDDSITAEDLRSMFNNDPQGSAELIRARGRCLYSDRMKDDTIKIR